MALTLKLQTKKFKTGQQKILQEIQIATESHFTKILKKYKRSLDEYMKTQAQFSKMTSVVNEELNATSDVNMESLLRGMKDAYNEFKTEYAQSFQDIMTSYKDQFDDISKLRSSTKSNEKYAEVAELLKNSFLRSQEEQEQLFTEAILELDFKHKTLMEEVQLQVKVPKMRYPAVDEITPSKTPIRLNLKPYIVPRLLEQIKQQES